MKFSYKTRIVALVLALVVINILAICITLVDKGSYKNSLYYRFTRQRFAWIVGGLPPNHAIQAGWAKVNITPAFKTPMTSDQASRSWATVHDSLYTRAVVLDNGTTLAAIITIDLLLMPPTVAQELQKRLPTIGFDWKNVYLGATYSQHSLGGWANDYMGKKTEGDYNEHLVVHLAEAIVKAVASAKQTRAAVQIGYNLANAGEETGGSGEAFHGLKLRKLTGESAFICSSEVFPVASNSTSALSRDYAGMLTDKLEQATNGFVLFMVGSLPASATKTADSGSVKDVARRVDSLVAQVAPLLSSQLLHTDSTLVAQTTPLVQNDPQIRISKNLRLKPWLAKELYGEYPAELKALRIGKTVFVGVPGAFSDLLLPAFGAMSIAKRNNLIITSLNGGNIGQIVPDDHYDDPQSPYPIGDVNRFGPHTGAFVEDMVQSLVNSLR